MDNTDTYLVHCRWYYKKNGTNKISNLEGNIFIEIPNNFQNLEDIRDCFKKIQKELKTKKFLKEIFKEEVDKNGNYKVKRVAILNMTKIREGKEEKKEEKPKMSEYTKALITLMICATTVACIAMIFV